MIQIRKKQVNRVPIIRSVSEQELRQYEKTKKAVIKNSVQLTKAESLEINGTSIPVYSDIPEKVKRLTFSSSGANDLLVFKRKYE